MALRPTPKDLEKLKTPFGMLIRGPPDETISQLGTLVRQGKPPVVVAVGDVVSRETLRAGVRVNLRIVDNRTMRTDLPSAAYPAKREYTVKNPPGVITDEARQIIREAASEESSVIFVEGEEDLLVLPAILAVPIRSLVVYGQPREGLVAVTVTQEKKKEVQEMIDRMTQG
jgi:GTP-dependent dephospho-CoA kinase